jgi:3-phenylpropionate/trans-cinnamate dioxygenase ferredoxin subunit
MKPMSEFVKVAKAADIPAGVARVYQANGRRVVVCNVDGDLYAIDDICPHDGGDLGEGELDEFAIECPRHGARFDVRSGEVMALPAVKPVNGYAVKIEGDDIFVALD